MKKDNSETEKKEIKIEINQGESIEFIPQEEPGEGKIKEAKDGSSIKAGEEEQKTEIKEAEVEIDPKDEEIKRLKAKVQKKETEIKNLRKEKEEWKEKYLRALAEMENARKRLEREREEFTRFSLSEFLKELLTVVDNFERALESRDESNGRPFQEGVIMIYRQLLDLLRKQGVRPVESQEKKFDPTIHQALMSEEADGIDEPEVAEIFQKGYWLHDRLLRPALVKVYVPRKNQ
ncbi:MAG: nucleotide exchange factor GrpE [Candidatus Aminicenantes bacterium]|nr:nucleotide exchange factor GrpE [Candidatus Aminicenantes bacterium]